MFFSFKTVGELQVIYQPLSRPKQIRAGKMRLAEKLDWKGLKLISHYFSKHLPSDIRILQSSL
jgi:hypothetical protein